MNDVEKVGLLLETMDDYLPGPNISRVYTGALPGAQASRYVPCEECSRPIEPRRMGCGRVRNRKPCVKCLEYLERIGRLLKRHDGHGCSWCERCEKTGVRRRNRHDDALREDGEPTTPYYDDNLVPLSEHVENISHDVLGDYLVLGDEVYWLKERQRYEGAGSYVELRKQLAWLERSHPSRHSMLIHWLETLGDALWSWSQEALAGIESTKLLIARRMREQGKILVPSWVVAAHEMRKHREEKEAA